MILASMENQSNINTIANASSKSSTTEHPPRPLPTPSRTLPPTAQQTTTSMQETKSSSTSPKIIHPQRNQKQTHEAWADIDDEQDEDGVEYIEDREEKFVMIIITIQNQ